MSHETFTTLLVNQDERGYHADIHTLSQNDLPPGDVLVAVEYSSLNYKDALAVTGKGKIFRAFPGVPGVDLVGTVLESQSPTYTPGDQVIVTGWGIGELTWGGYTQRARLQSAWLVPLPPQLTPIQAMGIGTAGITAMLCVLALEAHGVAPGEHEVIVTGAAGGVGSVAVAVLAKLGYAVAASTGRAETHAYLRDLGATTIIDRAELAATAKRPLESERWAGGVDTVGSTTLATLLRQTVRGGSVAACGLAGGNDLPTSVLPFILRGVNLLGIDSVMAPRELRTTAWARLAGGDLPLDKLDAMLRVEPLSNINALSDEILNGQVRGRIVVDVHA